MPHLLDIQTRAFQSLLVPDDVPLRAALGPYADAISNLHTSHGVSIRSHARVHGVRLVGEAQAPPADSTPPRLSATLPASVRLGTVRIPVRCSEACQVQAQLWDDPADRADALAELRAGRASTLTLTPDNHSLIDWETSGARTLHLRLRASDRAGNVTTLTRIVRVGDSPS